MPILSESRGRPSRRTESRKQLLDATERLLAGGESYADLAVEKISAEAGVARSTFYVQFPDRRALLLALAQRAAAPLVERLATLAESSPAPDETRVRAGMHTVVGLARTHAPIFRAVVEAAAYDPELRAYWHGLNDQLASLLAQRFAEHRSDDWADTGPPGPTARVLVDMVAAACFRQVSDETELSDDEVADALSRVWWRAVYGRA